MAPNLRSSSHVRSNNSRPSTPLNAPTTTSPASSFTESTRPRKQRRTGRDSRVATDPPHGTPSQIKSLPEKSGAGAVDTASDSQLSEKGTEWSEPPVRAPAPSYADTPWSAVSSDANPVLATMRPLGTMPTAADLRKAGLAPAKPSTQNIAAKKEQRSVPIGDKEDGKPQTPLTPAEDPVPEPVLKPVSPSDTTEQIVHKFTSLPVSHSTDIDVEKLRDAVENAFGLAVESNNRAVMRGLARFWDACTKDSFTLSVLENVCLSNTGPREQSAFQTVMRSAWKEVRSELNSETAPSATPIVGRTRSASSVSSLSSAKSLDAETFAPGMAPGAANPRVRARGKNAKQTPKPKGNEAPEPPSRRSAFPSSDAALQRKRALEEDPEYSTNAIKAKRTRMQKSLPKITATESRLRSSLASEPPSAVSTPAPTTAGRSVAVSDGPVIERRGRSESPASSDAGDNRRLTPTLTTSRDEREENNDFCRECNGSGQLLCCDGCVNSFHFSCLNPPLDPANPPEGDWFCPKCSFLKPMGTILAAVDQVSSKDFTLPARYRDYFAGVRTGEGGKYEEIVPLTKTNPRGGRGNRTGRYDDPYLLRTMDAKGKLIFCHICGRTSNGRRPIIQCDHCVFAFHMDCIDPPMAIPPNQKPNSEKVHHNWMCPLHSWNDLYYKVKDEEGYDMIKHIRRPKYPRLIDIEVLPDDEEDERIEEQESQGFMYRVPEKGIKLNFIERVKRSVSPSKVHRNSLSDCVSRENVEMAMKKAASERFFQYATTKLDELTAKAYEYYSSKSPAVVEEDTTAAILSSRTAAEREAATNLIAFAQSNDTDVEKEKISLLIDQLKAHAPNNLPSAENEIASLRSLQDLIEQRISTLNARSETTKPPTSKPIEFDLTDS
ncbi:hypothetical protein BDV25DRAFT_94586 [Aspergillus avenaceus]|uniref:PHD-type domain-containing protein n=1 Tax=Aspergillus avenaceus TaxID=36643 RepID=A0A5N6U7Z7_ASPAV|nr:hypothetical protein BDV25DRAFT_94586 [Aspergillus avenaceus]